MEEELSQREVARIFEESWRELIKEYGEARMLSTFCSEADIELHLAHKLLKKLPSETIHIEFPVPFKVKRFATELLAHGRVIARPGEYFRPDIVIIDPLEGCPYLFAELKFTPIYWSYLPLYLAEKKVLSKEDREKLKEDLRRTINYLKRVRQEEPTQRYIEETYFGVDKQGHTNIKKLIEIINDFKEKEQETVAGYLCVIDEIYPNIEKMLQKAIKKYNPPRQFKILAQYFTVYENLEKVLEDLNKE